MKHCRSSPDVHFDPMSPETRRVLEMFFDPWNAELRHLLQRRHVRTVPGYGVQLSRRRPALKTMRDLPQGSGANFYDESAAHGNETARSYGERLTRDWWWSYPKEERRTHRSGTDKPWPLAALPPVNSPAATRNESIGYLEERGTVFAPDTDLESEHTNFNEAIREVALAEMEEKRGPLAVDDAKNDDSGVNHPKEPNVRLKTETRRRCSKVACWDEINVAVIAMNETLSPNQNAQKMEHELKPFIAKRKRKQRHGRPSRAATNRHKHTRKYSHGERKR